ncbi:hypothetical protein [Rhodococcus sp. H29-C3]|uniref:hypothetical protein n=1 Tax=Rhodococcus sp. H29-C3 TaxID=3046307 RepID=UPI0024BB9102|nr:hypothetical protein [Rhodococcus sp. H29-C3]MDJ0362298.1 hypothetical protein [Rhodococcus sp. H29-C3]
MLATTRAWRARLGQHLLCQGDESAMRGRPGHTMTAGDFGDRSCGVADRPSHRSAESAGQSRTRGSSSMLSVNDPRRQ